MTTVASTTAAPPQSLEEDDEIEIAMLNYGDINNNPLEYGSMIDTTENSTFDKMNNEAKISEILEKLTHIFRDMEHLHGKLNIFSTRKSQNISSPIF